MNQSLSAPGLCHIVQNAVHSCTDPTEHFSSTWIEWAKNMCILLRRKYSNPRLIETWFKDPPVCHHKHWIVAFTHGDACWNWIYDPLKERTD